MVMSPVHQVWLKPCLPFTRSGQNHLARHSERRKKTRQTEEEVGTQHQCMDRPGDGQVPEDSREQRKMEKTGCKIICGAPMTLTVKGLVMVMMMMKKMILYELCLKQQRKKEEEEKKASDNCFWSLKEL